MADHPFQDFLIPWPADSSVRNGPRICIWSWSGRGLKFLVGPGLLSWSEISHFSLVRSGLDQLVLDRSVLVRGNLTLSIRTRGLRSSGTTKVPKNLTPTPPELWPVKMIMIPMVSLWHVHVPVFLKGIQLITFMLKFFGNNFMVCYNLGLMFECYG